MGEESSEQDQGEEAAHALQSVDLHIFQVQAPFLIEAIRMLDAGTVEPLVVDRACGVLVAIRKNGAIQDHGLGGQSLQELLSRRAVAAGVSDVHWHDARRTLAGNLLDAGTDLATVQRILGHSSPVTTSAYDRRPEETRRRALRGLHVPYLRRRLL